MRTALPSEDYPVETLSVAFLSHGRPDWLPEPEGARWARCQTSVQVGTRIVDGTSLQDDDGVLELDSGPHIPPGVMPRLLVPPEPTHHSYGRPRRVDADREMVRYVAWARYIAGLTTPQLAKLLHDDDFPRSRPGILKQIERYAADGRRLYHAMGVLPWGAYTDGCVPNGWRSDPAFVAGVRRWQAEAVEHPADERQPGELGEPLPAPLAAVLRAAGTHPFAELIKQISANGPLGLHGPVRNLAILRDHGIEPWQPSYP